LNGSQNHAPPAGASFVAHAKYWLWKLVTIIVLAPIYCSVIAEGLRMLVPALGQKLHKLPIPAFSTFGQYEETRRLDLAIFMALFLLVAVWWLWEQVLKVFLSNEDTFHDSGWNAEAYKRVVLILGIIILGADACLFYASMVQIGWGGTRLSVPALLATAAYLAVIVFVSLVSLNLRKPFAGR
jgi:hypothetical protein